VNISSVSGGYSVPFLGAYAGSKHALEAITQAFRRELLSQGIHVCAIEPNFIKSRSIDAEADNSKTLTMYQDTKLAKMWVAFHENIASQFSKAKDPEIVCKAVIHALESKKPKTRYPLDASWRIGRWLTDTAFDKGLFKELGIQQFVKR
jgi:NAD(P)-dependent dehydrogenase (short-subunit alcohol dehydrogenase family)